MRLVIAEKPSVAQSLGSVLGAKQRREGYLEGNGYFISWCYGHLAELSDTSAYDETYTKWKLDHLPIIPSTFRFTIREDRQKQFELLKSLLRRDDVIDVVNACDAGREGELIFRTVYHLAGCTKPILRLWISSMEDEAIRSGFKNLRSGEEFDGLYQAALCRSKADWLVGINATRLFSLLYGPTLNIGRVMSPTLALIVQREAEIKAFSPQPYYTVQLDCGFSCNTEKMRDKQTANDLAAACRDKLARVIHLENKEVVEKAPLLYDLTTLQRDANRILGYTAQQTLDYAQALYEKKLCTYPRTDSKYLTDDMAVTVPQLVTVAASICGTEASFPQTAQICNTKMVSDHHAIILTGKANSDTIRALPLGEREIMKMIARRLLCAVGSPYKTKDTHVSLECGGHTFSSKGKTVIELGWRRYSAAAPEERMPLPELSEDMELVVSQVTVKGGKTTAPKRYTEDTLLSAMEHAGAADMPEDAERRGIGTPATRAGILEKLISSGFVQRKKIKSVVQLQPTELGMALITVLPEHLQSPCLTAEWEHRLKEVECGELDADLFLKQISDMVSNLVKTYQPIPNAHVLFASGPDFIGNCPCCNAPVIENSKGYACRNRSCYFALWKNNRFFTAKRIELTRELATKLVLHKKAWLENCYSEKTGKTYNALALLVDDGTKISFKMDFRRGSSE